MTEKKASLHLVTEADAEQTEQDDPLVGETISKKYTILRRIGQGGMGSVYLAEHHTLKTEVAIKVLNPNMGKVAAERFHYEARTASQIKSPHIVQVLDFFEDEDKNFCLVMEFVQGTTLAEIVEREGPLSAERTLNIVQQVAWALAKAHEVGIVHRDIKPENIMVTDVGGSEFVKLMDFGIASVISEDQRKRLNRRHMTLELSGIIGTPEFMAPEQVACEPPDARTDIYALAAVCYFLLTGGRLPVWSENVSELLSKIIHQAPTPIGEHIPDLAPLWLPLSKALAKARNDRYVHVQAFVDALTEAAGLPVRPSRASGQHQSLGTVAHAQTIDATVARRRPMAIDSQASTQDSRSSGPNLRVLAAGLGAFLALAMAMAFLIADKDPRHILHPQPAPAAEVRGPATDHAPRAMPHGIDPPAPSRVEGPAPTRVAPPVVRTVVAAPVAPRPAAAPTTELPAACQAFLPRRRGAGRAECLRYHAAVCAGTRRTPWCDVIEATLRLPRSR